MATADVHIFATNLRCLMRHKDLDDRELALALRMDPPRIRAWLGGSCFPKQDAMVKICEHFEYYDIFKLITEKIKI